MSLELKAMIASSQTSALIMFHTFTPSDSNIGNNLFTELDPEGSRIAITSSEYLNV